MERLERYKEAFRELPAGCREAEVNALFTDLTTIVCEKGERKRAASSMATAVFLRATGERTGTVYTENLEDDPQELIRQALLNAEAVSEADPRPFAAGRTDRAGQEGAPTDIGEMERYGVEVSKREGVELCEVTRLIRRSRVVNSLGLDTTHLNPLWEVSIGICGKGEDNYKILTRSAADLKAIDPDAMIRTLQEESRLAHEELPLIDLPSGTYDAVLSNDVVIHVMNTVWQFFVKKYMDTDMSCFHEGERIGSSVLSIVDEAISPYTAYDFSIDYEGVRGPERISVVRDGVIETALATNREGGSTGSAGRDDLFSGVLRTDLIALPRNLYIRGGSGNAAELTERMGTGIHLTYSLDEYHSTNIAAGTYAIPCGGVYYENGKPVGRVQQMSFYGNFRDLFASLEACADDVKVVPMEQYRSYCFGGPSLLVRGAKFSL